MERERNTAPRQSAYIPGEKHRLENEGSKPLILIEVQTGSYFGEDEGTAISINGIDLKVILDDTRMVKQLFLD